MEEEKATEQQMLAADLPPSSCPTSLITPQQRLPNSLGHHKIESTPGTSLVVQQLRFHTSTASGPGLILGEGTKMPWGSAKTKTQQRKKLVHECS